MERGILVGLGLPFEASLVLVSGFYDYSESTSSTWQPAEVGVTK
jgi:hypothetical protein